MGPGSGRGFLRFRTVAILPQKVNEALSVLEKHLEGGHRRMDRVMGAELESRSSGFLDFEEIKSKFLQKTPRKSVAEQDGRGGGQTEGSAEGAGQVGDRCEGRTVGYPDPGAGHRGGGWKFEFSRILAF